MAQIKTIAIVEQTLELSQPTVLRSFDKWKKEPRFCRAFMFFEQFVSVSDWLSAQAKCD